MTTLNIKEWRPAKGMILGEILDGDYTSPGGIIVIQSLKRKEPRKVRVIAVGEPKSDRKGILEEIYAKVGQIVYFKLSEGIRIEINRKGYLFLENKDIVAVETGE